MCYHLKKKYETNYRPLGTLCRDLRRYPEAQRSLILDALFKPQHLASLQMLKVEIGAHVII